MPEQVSEPSSVPISAQVSEPVEERIKVDVPAADVYAAVATVRRMARWSPECFAVWVYRRRAGQPTRFVGFNRRKGYVWFTNCRVLIADPDREFAFDGGTEVTEYWLDRRSPGAWRLGRIFTGRSSGMRPVVNRDGMRTTLHRL